MNEGWVRSGLTFLASLGATALGLLLFMVGAGVVGHGALWGWTLVIPACGCLAIALMLVNRLPRNQ